MHHLASTDFSYASRNVFLAFEVVFDTAVRYTYLMKVVVLWFVAPCSVV